MEKQLEAWLSTLTPREVALHNLAKIKLKKNLNANDPTDQGSYFPERSRAFQAWLKEKR
jgi:hypothetical protein